MESNLIIQNHLEIHTLLDNKHLKKAFQQLKELIRMLGEWRYETKMEELETAYQYMLRYMGDGMADPQRDKLYGKLLADTYALADIVTDRFLQRGTSSLYYSKRRLFLNGTDSIDKAFKRLENELGNLSLAELIDTNEPENQKKIIYLHHKTEEEAEALFNGIWTNLAPSVEEQSTLQAIFAPQALPVTYQALMISALTLSLMQWYDEHKLFILADLVLAPNEELNQRALVGLLLISQKHAKRMMTTPIATNRINALLEQESVVQQIRTIQAQLIRTRETERITRKLNEEILPEMMKMAPSIYNKIKPDDVSSESTDPDLNPEWEDYLGNSNIGDKLKEISELQMEGSDVLMSAFSNLKNFTFFHSVSNWFLPFFKTNSSLISVTGMDKKQDQLLSFIAKSRFMCNSDKYSFCLSLLQMPEMQRNMMAEQFYAQGEELSQLQKMDEQSSPTKRIEMTSNLYIQDLYRFYKLHTQQQEFEDPFKKDLNFFHHPLFDTAFSDLSSLHLLAELFFRKEFYKDATEIYLELTNRDQSNFEFYQKLGYCYQTSGNYEKAIQAYKQADIIHPDSLWTLRRLALCFRNLKKPAEALHYYERFCKIKPDNLSVELNMGHCYLELKDYENALNHYFKVDYLDHTHHKAWRPIAWCSFLVGKYEQAQRYYNKILAQHPSALDYMNAAHTEWAIGSIRTAIKYYRKSLYESVNDKEVFEKTYLHDKNDLLHAGITETDFYLMLDQIMYDSEQI